MRIDVLTAFPERFSGMLQASILRRALERDCVRLWIHNLRHFTRDRHGQLDDYPYGGGPGMILRAEPVFDALERLFEGEQQTPELVYLTPQGRLFCQEMAREQSRYPWLVILCGHYKDVDARILQRYPWQEISIGDYVLSGGEVAAAVWIDAVVRLVPGVLGDEESALCDSFEDGLLDAPYFTRPEEIAGLSVPEVLLSGNHARIKQWRKDERRKRTRERRPDLWQRYQQTKNCTS
ncbi:MAG: tRNA (guanosine(37)-N1)-methyltransferase TrmD [bacterium]